MTMYSLLFGMLGLRGELLRSTVFRSLSFMMSLYCILGRLWIFVLVFVNIWRILKSVPRR